MASFHSKEDDVSRILILIFITNFSDSFSAKDLFYSCKQYGHVVNSFIPTKRAKDGKRFGFVRFINVFNVERLVNNLCTIWVGRLKFHANVARFKREFMKGSGNTDKMENVLNKSKPKGPHKEVGKSVIGKSFMSVVKDSKLVKETKSSPAIVLEDDCLNARDLSLSLMGRVKELASSANLKKALCNEGFDGVKISYLGELWILLEFETAKAKDSFRGSVGAGSWFSILKQAYAEFVPEGELLDVDDYDETNFHFKSVCILTKVYENIYESFKIVFWGKVYWVCASEVPGWTPEFSEDEEEDNLSVEGNNNDKPNVYEVNNDNEESDMEAVLETVFDEPDEQKDNQSEDPFGFYPLLNKENNKMAQKLGGYATKVYGENKRGDNLFVNLEVGKDNSDSVNKNSESTCSGRFKEFEIPRTGGSILSLMEDVVKVGQTMGYNMDGCIKDITDYLSHVSNQWDGKIVMMGDFNEVRYKSFTPDGDLNEGNVVGGHATKVYGENERGDNLFVNLEVGKDNSDSVNKNSESAWIDILIVVVYAPQEAKEKRMLWDYLSHVSNQWDGKIVMMSDFNERYISDHRPILLREAMFDYGPIPFRFYRYWLEVDGFDKLVRDSWNVVPVNKRNAIRNFICKLKFLKERIRSRVSIHRMNSRGEISLLKEELRYCDEVIDKGECSREVVHKRSEILNKIHQVNNIQASEIAQKAKIKWVVEGDENVKFFMIQVKLEFFDHFRGRFDKPSENRACIDISFPNSLSNDQKEDLECKITKEEVKRAVWDCGVDKFLGPDGFSFSFYRHFWTTIEHGVFEAVDYFFMHSDMPNGCNSNFIALIPKILDANMVKDFRPISLIGSLYKIIAKILANRLVGVLDDLVNEVQSAFVADRQILDGPFIHNEEEKHTLIFKVDFEKAYDSVRWDFLDDVLNKFGFGEKWRTWIQSCLRSSRGFILVNDQFHGEFVSFVLRMIQFFLANGASSIFESLVQVLECFFRASGLRIDMCKSKIMGVNVVDGKVKNAAVKLGCLVLKTSFTYLGTKVGDIMSRKHAWKEVVDKVLFRLSIWKMKIRSIGGRFTLLKSVLGSMPIFHMSIFKVPSSILKTLESIRSWFFNGQDPKSKKASWLKWNNVLTPKDKGGIRGLKLVCP
nr:RNA-directed DNA polymerase, eukaryota [Tanacetum cinerariifolium]